MNLFDKENIDAGAIIPTTLTEERHVLQNIECSVQALQARIQYLLKQDSRHRKKLENAYHSSVATVKHKLFISSQHRRQQNMHQMRDRGTCDTQYRVKQLKEKQQEEFNAAKESIGQIKKEERDHIRQLSRKNRKVIEDSQKQQMEKKRQNVSIIRTEKEQFKAELARMAQERRQQLFQHKLQQHLRNEEKKKQMIKRIQAMQRTQKELVQKIKRTSQNTNQFACLKKVASKMSLQKFDEIVSDVKSKEKNIADEKATEKILEYILKYKDPIDKSEELTVREKKQSPQLGDT